MLTGGITLYKQAQRTIYKGVEFSKVILSAFSRTQVILEYLLLPSLEIECIFKITLLELKGNLINEFYIHGKRIETLDMYLYKILIAIGEPFWQYPVGYDPLFGSKNQEKIQKT